MGGRTLPVCLLSLGSIGARLWILIWLSEDVSLSWGRASCSRRDRSPGFPPRLIPQNRAFHRDLPAAGRALKEERHRVSGMVVLEERMKVGPLKNIEIQLT